MSEKKGLNSKNTSQALKGIMIPPRPQLLLDIQAVHPELPKIAELIKTDQGVCAGVLKAVNSSLYALPKKISSINHAVMLLGVNSTLNIVNGLMLRAALGSQKITPELNNYWHTTNQTAVVCASIHRQLGFGSSDLPYLLGLFHNCGIPLLMHKFEDYFDGAQESYLFQNNSILTCEDKAYDTNHADVGFMMSRYWSLPKEICEAIRDHHNTRILRFDNERVKEEVYSLLAVLKMAEHTIDLARQIGSQEEDYEWVFIKNALFDYVGLDEASYEDLARGALLDLSEFDSDGNRMLED